MSCSAFVAAIDAYQTCLETQLKETVGAQPDMTPLCSRPPRCCNGISNNICRSSALQSRGNVRTAPYSHSMVAGGLPVTSYTTRLTPLTSLTMRREQISSNS